VDASCVRVWLGEVAASLEAERDFLTQLDAAIGDADHGVNMHRGFTAVMARITGVEEATPGQLLRIAGRTFVSTVGGAAGPLYGTAFLQAGEALGDHETFGPRLLGDALRASLEGVQRVGAASVGDKTMVDALTPALGAYELELRMGGSLETAASGARDAGHHPAPGPQGPRLLPGPAQRRPPGPGRDLDRADVRRPRTGRGRRPLPAVRRRGPAPGERAVIQSVGRAARILKALGSESARLGVTELAERLGLAKATVHGLLRTLEAHQLVEQDLETGKYRLGPALLQLGNAFLDNNELRARSLLWAETLAGRAREAVHVGVLYGPNVLLVHHVFRPDNSLQILQVGASIPWHACALGKASVAYLEPQAQAELLAGPLPRLTGRTLTVKAALQAELEAVVDTGVAVEDQEAIVGEGGIAAALFDNRGAVVGAIGVAGPVERLLPDGPAAAAVAAVKEAARGLSRELGAGRPALPGAGA
jgi:dihydroxyacetone kinase phosphoprotein-dependent L subunit